MNYDNCLVGVSESIAIGPDVFEANRDAFAGSLADFARPQGPDLLSRTAGLLGYLDCRRQAGVWPYSRSLASAPGPEATIAYDDGMPGSGVNFASQDYLSLASHPEILTAGIDAMRSYGVHSAGSPCLLGNTTLSLKLERLIGEFVSAEHVTLFSTGWGAGYGSIQGLVRPYDHIVLDELAHACLAQGAAAATRNIRRSSHLSTEHVRQLLAEIRARDTHNGILVVTEGLFSMDSDSPDLAGLQEACHEYSATLLVDVAHDLGSQGPEGTGQLGLQNMLGSVDLVMGSFSKTFASNGGFLASKRPSVKDHVKAYGNTHMFSNALSPVQAATIIESLRIVRSHEGDYRRRQLSNNVHMLRNGFERRGMRVGGAPSAIVPVHVGVEAVARQASFDTFRRGIFANLVEYPAVARGGARFRMQVQADHSELQVNRAVAVICEAVNAATEAYSRSSLSESSSAYAPQLDAGPEVLLTT